jgi:hypothetical protein
MYCRGLLGFLAVVTLILLQNGVNAGEKLKISYKLPVPSYLHLAALVMRGMSTPRNLRASRGTCVGSQWNGALCSHDVSQAVDLGCGCASCSASATVLVLEEHETRRSYAIRCKQHNDDDDGIITYVICAVLCLPLSVAAEVSWAALAAAWHGTAARLAFPL